MRKYFGFVFFVIGSGFVSSLCTHLQDPYRVPVTVLCMCMGFMTLSIIIALPASPKDPKELEKALKEPELPKE